MPQDGPRAKAYQPGQGKRYQTQRSKFGQSSKILKSGDGSGKMRDGVNPTLNKKTDSIIKDVFLIPSKDLSTVPRGKKGKEMYTNSLVATGVEFNILMEHWDIIQALLDGFSFVPEIGRHLGTASSYNFEFVKAVDDDLTILNPSLRWNLKMVRHVTGAGPLYIRFSGDIQRYLKTNMLLVNHVSSDESCSDVSDAEVNTNQNSLMNTGEGPKSSLSASSKATTSATVSATQQTVPTLFKKMESETSNEAKVSPICHRLLEKQKLVNMRTCLQKQRLHMIQHMSQHMIIYLLTAMTF